MTDTSQFLNNAVGITSDLAFNLKNSAVASRSYRASIPMTNRQTAAPSDICIFNIPARRNCFLDTANSYMRLTVKNNDLSGNINFDHNAYSVINRLDVFHGSVNLETIQQLNVLANALFDFQLNGAQKTGYQVCLGLAQVKL
jgi:hypothetical protein